jgi:hypothetical protein
VAHAGRVVDVKAHLLNYVDVKPDESEVLERPVQATIGSWLANRGTHVGGDLGLGAHICSVWFAITHASVLKDISTILALVQKEVVMSLLH